MQCRQWRPEESLVSVEEILRYAFIAFLGIGSGPSGGGPPAGSSGGGPPGGSSGGGGAKPGNTRQFYVDKQGNLITVAQINKYRHWQAEGRTLAYGQRHALNRINIRPFPNTLTSGTTVSDAFNIYLGNDVLDATLSAAGFPPYDLGVNVNFAGVGSRLYDLERAFGNWTVFNSNQVFFNTFGTFAGVGSTGFYSPFWFNLIVTR